MAPVVSDRGARQGPKGRTILYVLVASLVLCGIFLVGAMTWSGKQPPEYGNQSQEAARKAATTPSVSSSNTAGVPAANPAYPAPAEKK